MGSKNKSSGNNSRTKGSRNKKIEKLKLKIVSGKYRIDNFDLAKALFLAR